MVDEKEVIPPPEGDQKPAEGQEKQPDQKPEDQKPADSTDQKPVDDKKDSEAKDDQQDTAKDVPEKYDLKLPDGSPLGPETVPELTAFSKEIELTGKQAQAVLERENSNAIKVKQFVENLTDKVWPDEAKADKEIGGDNFNKVAEVCKRAVEKLGTDKFKKELDESRLGNNPEFLRFVYRLVSSSVPSEFIKGSQPPDVRKPTSEVLYGGTSSSTKTE